MNRIPRRPASRITLLMTLTLLAINLLADGGCSLSNAALPDPSIQALHSADTRPDGAACLTTPPAGASDQNPAFSPDGTRLVFTRFDAGYNDGPASLFVLDVGDSQVTRLTPVEDQDNVNLPGSAWVSSGAGDVGRIVFSSDRHEADDLWRIAPDGTDFTRVTTHTGALAYVEPSWSPDGQWITFEATQPGAGEDGRIGQIWKVRADGSAAVQLTDGTCDDRQPNWSPAGDRILFQRRAPGSDDWDIYTMTPAGGDVRQVTTTPAGDTDASWSPGGDCIVYSSDYGGLAVANIFVISAAGGTPTRLTRADAYDGAPSWSPDGQWIAFESFEGQGADGPSALWRIAVPEGICADENLVYLPLVLTATPPPWWQPPVGASWQWQLIDLPLDTSHAVDVYDVDLFDNDAATVAALHAQGRRVFCYISVGSWEDWRPDADQFPEAVLGNDYEDWEDEKWLDIRQIDALAPIMRARFDQCQAKGFDGVEPDNVDGYTNDTGFDLTYQDQLDYNVWLANEAHARGLSIGLKNDGGQVGDLLAYFDWAMTEDCFAYAECDVLAPFVSAGKPVFAAEYTDEMTIAYFTAQVCPQAQAMQFSPILKYRDLDAWRQACP